jgi:hypothetical protein
LLSFAACATASAIATAAEIEVRGSRPGLDRARLESLVHLELGDRADDARVIVTIASGNERAEIVLEAQGERRQGAVELRGASDVERTIALLIGELARNTSMPPAPTSTPAPSPTTATPATAPPTSNATPTPTPTPTPTAPTATTTTSGLRGAAPPRIRAHVLGAMGARWLSSDGALLLTPHIEAGVVVNDTLRLGGVARYATAGADDPLGSVRAHTATGGLAATVRFASSGRLAAWTGPRFELGYATARGEGTGGASASALLASGGWAVEGRASLGPLDALLVLDAGWLARGLDLRADDRTALALSGAFVGVSLGLGLR